MAGAAIAVGYLVRGVGAMEDNALVWLSPFGWAQRMNAFGDERWWPALVLLAATAVLLAFAGRLTAGRDFGGGLLETRPDDRVPAGCCTRRSVSSREYSADR